MVDKIEMSLDDIIKSTKGLKVRRGAGQARRGAGGGGGAGGGRPIRKGGRPMQGAQRSSGGGSGGGSVLKGRNRGGIQKSNFPRGDVNSAWKHDMYDGPKRGLGGGGGGLKTSNGGVSSGPSKLLVSNLDYGVSESDIHELFADFGPLKSASMHYDRSGRSLGTADVVFERRADAVKAMKQYNGVPLDGRPMNIQLATSEVPSPVSKSRLASGPSSRPRPQVGGGNLRRGPGGPRRGGGGGGAPRSAGGAGGRRNGTPKAPAPTAEELDAELDAYVNDMK
ncbi:THO complex subunit 4 [Eupeodes corollae]|uniref:THO complex subunit 4 n=1 Tax=Eupeodes corollae TaxID=290404 RepID=UPI002492D0FF|nr:THO complex subunit 4 [Eupeodes corollae]